MATSFLTHGLANLGDLLTTSLYHYIWSDKSSLHIPPTYGPPPSMRTKEAEEDRILSLPGLSTMPSFGQFSGYLEVAPTRHIFYWYVESTNDPDSDPLVLWSNGGPSCSGLIGFFTEHGPFRVDENLELLPNPFAWNQMANMLFIEQPSGVGFSMRDPSDKSKCNDEQSAIDNMQLVEAFYERFPERLPNPLYLASESYGGHYIPQLALQILNNDQKHSFKLAGFLVGNPYVDPYTNFVAEVEAIHGHGLLPRPLVEKWRKTCANPDTWQSEDCSKLVANIYDIIEPGFNVYALDFPVCLAVTKSRSSGQDFPGRFVRGRSRVLEETETVGRNETVHAVTHQVQTLRSLYSVHTPRSLPEEDPYEPCLQLHMREYLSQEAVQQAIHVKSKEPIQWIPCNIGINYDMNDVDTSVIDAYKELVEMGKDGLHSLRMMIFSGDDDSVCATDGTQAWLFELPMDVKDFWEPWKVNGQVAGYWTKFDLQAEASFDFVTVHGAGHEVPTYKPTEALELFRLFLHR